MLMIGLMLMIGWNAAPLMLVRRNGVEGVMKLDRIEIASRFVFGELQLAQPNRFGQLDSPPFNLVLAFRFGEGSVGCWSPRGQTLMIG